MTDQSVSAHFQALLESALQAYEQKTGIKLAQYPLAVQIRNLQSDDDINTLLQCQAQVLDDIQASDRIIKSIKKTLSIVVPLSAEVTLAVGLASPKALIPDFKSLTICGQSSNPAKAIQSSLAILLDVCTVL
jgi:hypothetical protein